MADPLDMSGFPFPLAAITAANEALSKLAERHGMTFLSMYPTRISTTVLAAAAPHLGMTVVQQPAPVITGSVVGAVIDALSDLGDPSDHDTGVLATAAIIAAEPYIRADENEACALLAEQHKAHYHACGVPCSSEHSERPFADLIRNRTTHEGVQS